MCLLVPMPTPCWLLLLLLLLMRQGEELDGTGGTRPLAMFSNPITPTCSSRSRHQLVGFSWQHQAFDTVWQVRPLTSCEATAPEAYGQAQPCYIGAGLWGCCCCGVPCMCVFAGN